MCKCVPTKELLMHKFKLLKFIISNFAYVKPGFNSAERVWVMSKDSTHRRLNRPRFLSFRFYSWFLFIIVGLFDIFAFSALAKTNHCIQGTTNYLEFQNQLEDDANSNEDLLNTEKWSSLIGINECAKSIEAVKLATMMADDLASAVSKNVGQVPSEFISFFESQLRPALVNSLSIDADKDDVTIRQKKIEIISKIFSISQNLSTEGMQRSCDSSIDKKSIVLTNDQCVEMHSWESIDLSTNPEQYIKMADGLLRMRALFETYGMNISSNCQFTNNLRWLENVIQVGLKKIIAHYYGTQSTTRVTGINLFQNQLPNDKGTQMIRSSLAQPLFNRPGIYICNRDCELRFEKNQGSVDLARVSMHPFAVLMGGLIKSADSHGRILSRTANITIMASELGNILLMNSNQLTPPNTLAISFYIPDNGRFRGPVIPPEYIQNFSEQRSVVMQTQVTEMPYYEIRCTERYIFPGGNVCTKKGNVYIGSYLSLSRDAMRGDDGWSGVAGGDAGDLILDIRDKQIAFGKVLVFGIGSSGSDGYPGQDGGALLETCTNWKTGCGYKNTQNSQGGNGGNGGRGGHASKIKADFSCHQGFGQYRENFKIIGLPGRGGDGGPRGRINQGVKISNIPETSQVGLKGQSGESAQLIQRN